MTTAPALRLFNGGPLRLLPALVREPRHAGLAILVGWLLSFSGSLALAFAAQGLAPDMAEPKFPGNGALVFVLLTVFAPVVETLIMALLLVGLTRFMAPTAAVFASAALWGIAHSLQAPLWGAIIWWPFLVFSTLFLVWRQRGFWAGIGVAAATHALQNLGPALMVVNR